MASLLSYSLCSVADVKESLGIPSSDTTKDNLIIRKINQATLAIEKYCGRRFAETTYTDTVYSGTNTDQIVLRQRPITDTTPLVLGTRDTSLNNDDFDDVESDLYFVNESAGVLDLNFRATGHWDKYRVTYSAGYATIPADLGEACASLACFYVNEADATSLGVAEKQEGQRRVKYAGSSGSGGGLSFIGIIAQLGIDEIINSYSNNPVMTDR